MRFEKHLLKKGMKQNLQLARLTWNLRIRPWKRKIMFQTIILRFYVNLLGCWLFDHFLAKIFEVRYFLVFFGQRFPKLPRKPSLGLGKRVSHFFFRCFFFSTPSKGNIIHSSLPRPILLRSFVSYFLFQMMDSPAKFNSSPLNIYGNPKGKANVFQPSFFRGELLNFWGVFQIQQKQEASRWFSDICYFHPYLGKISNLTIIFFQMGWDRRFCLFPCVGSLPSQRPLWF